MHRHSVFTTAKNNIGGYSYIQVNASSIRVHAVDVVVRRIRVALTRGHAEPAEKEHGREQPPKVST